MPILQRFLRIAVCAAVLLVGGVLVAESPDFSWLPPAPKLPPPSEKVIRVSTVKELFRAADQVEPGGTILLADGHYMMPRYFELRTDRVTLRSESGDRNKVILDGAESIHGELVGLRECFGVTIADLTIQNIRFNGFKLNTDHNVHRATIHNCVIHNIWQRGVKGVRVPKGVRPPQGCRIQYCLFYNDHAKRFEDDPADTAKTFNGNYIAGIDTMYADGWTVSDNVFFGIHGRTGEGRGAVFFWHESKDCVIERNVIVDCDSGICLGNSMLPEGVEFHCRRCVVRNNFVARCPENGILADHTENCRIVHNSIHDPESRMRRLIRLVHENVGLSVINNLVSGPPIRVETDSKVQMEGNVVQDLGSWFVDTSGGNLHLKGKCPEVVGRAGRIEAVPEDFDRQPRRQTTDVGAHQWR